MIELLKDLKAMGITAIVAGGAIRDNIRGVEPKDIDVWVLGNPAYDLEAVSKLVNCKAVIDLAGDQYDAIPVKHLIKGRYKDSKGIWRDIDIIFPQEIYSSPIELVSSFDYNINQGFVGLDCGVYKPDLSLLYVVNDARITEERADKFTLMVDMYNQQQELARNIGD